MRQMRKSRRSRPALDLSGRKLARKAASSTLAQRAVPTRKQSSILAQHLALGVHHEGHELRHSQLAR